MDYDKAINALMQKLTNLPSEAVFGLIFLGVLVLLFSLIVAVKASRRRTTIRVQAEPPLSRHHSTAQPPPIPERASDVLEITEARKLNGLGGLCVALMILTWIVALWVFFLSNNSIHEAVALMIWVGGNTMFGTGALLNQERTYRVIGRGDRLMN